MVQGKETCIFWPTATNPVCSGQLQMLSAEKELITGESDQRDRNLCTPTKGYKSNTLSHQLQPSSAGKGLNTCCTFWLQATGVMFSHINLSHHLQGNVYTRIVHFDFRQQISCSLTLATATLCRERVKHMLYTLTTGNRCNVLSHRLQLPSVGKGLNAGCTFWLGQQT